MNRIAAPFFMVLAGGCTAIPPAPREAPPPPKAEAPRVPAKGAAPAVKSPDVKTSAARAPAARAPVAAAKPAGPPPLDLKSLEQQLKETKAIGVMTKLSIKNQVDDLVEQFRGYYQGRAKTSLADLRRSYDLLVMKVLTLLQDGDQALAKAVANSREAIWGILADPNKFAKI
jgi:hypothetical protein